MKVYHICLVALSCVALAASSAIYRPDNQRDDDDPTPIPPPPPPPPFCPAQCLWSDIYNYPHFGSCNRYYHCIHGFFFDFACGVGEEFDHVTLRCLPEDVARCIFEGPIAIEDEEITTTEEPGVTEPEIPWPTE